MMTLKLKSLNKSIIAIILLGTFSLANAFAQTADSQSLKTDFLSMTLPQELQLQNDSGKHVINAQNEQYSYQRFYNGKFDGTDLMFSYLYQSNLLKNIPKKHLKPVITNIAMVMFNGVYRTAKAQFTEAMANVIKKDAKQVQIGKNQFMKFTTTAKGVSYVFYITAIDNNLYTFTLRAYGGGESQQDDAIQKFTKQYLSTIEF